LLCKRRELKSKELEESKGRRRPMRRGVRPRRRGHQPRRCLPRWRRGRWWPRR
jgi:hypothetical protein